jgi:hypothetical protein
MAPPSSFKGVKKWFDQHPVLVDIYHGRRLERLTRRLT